MFTTTGLPDRDLCRFALQHGRTSTSTGGVTAYPLCRATFNRHATPLYDVQQAPVLIPKKTTLGIVSLAAESTLPGASLSRLAVM